jgi:hypothetical protein
LLTATTTAGERLNPTSGDSIPSMSVNAVRTWMLAPAQAPDAAASRSRYVAKST